MKFGIGSKLAVLTTTLVCVTAGLLLWFMHQSAGAIVLKHDVVDLTHEIRLRASELSSELYAVRGDVDRLAKDPHLKDLDTRRVTDEKQGALEKVCQEKFYRSNYLWLEVVAVDATGQSRKIVALNAPLDPPTGFRPVTWIGNHDEFLASVRSYRKRDDDTIVSEIRRVDVRYADSDKPDRANVVWAGQRLTPSSGQPGEADVLVMAALDLNRRLPSPDSGQERSPFFKMISSPRRLTFVANEPPKGSAFAERWLMFPDDAEQPLVRALDLVAPFQELYLRRDKHLKVCQDLNLRPTPKWEPRHLIGFSEPRNREAIKLQKSLWYRQSTPIPREDRSAVATALSKFVEERRLGPGQRARLSGSMETLGLLANSKESLEELTGKVGRLPGIGLGWQGLLECDDCYFDFVLFPVRSADSEGGRRYYGLAQAALRDEMQADVNAELARLRPWMVAFICGAALLGFACSLVFTRPLKQITTTAQAFGKVKDDGKHAGGTWRQDVADILRRLPVRRRDEIGVLARAFRQMLGQVVEAHERLYEANADLDRRVQQRTAELERANEELKTARDKAHELSRAKDAFLASVSHELRNPLNQVSGFCQLLELTELDDEQRADVQKIRLAGSQLLTLINDILDYQKIIMGGITLEPEEIAVHELVQEIGDAMAFQARENRNQLQVHCTDDKLRLYADKQRVRQVLLNLVGNACKLTSDGSVSLRASLEQGGSGEVIRFDVLDTGRGMTPEEQAKLFRPFTKLSARQGNRSGTGLGLVICKGFCDLMHGTISLQSEFGKGSTFTVRLPVDTTRASPLEPTAGIAEAQASPRGEARSPEPPTLASVPPRSHAVLAGRSGSVEGADQRVPACSARSVLVVDDDPSAREMMQRHLESQGFHVVTAASGIEGLELAKRLRPAVITLDAVMPGLDGWAVLAALRTDHDTAHIPVVMVTITDDGERCFSLGAAEFLTKPVDWERLSKVLASYTGAKRDRSILVVDDEPEAREILRRQLERDGWQVLEAEHGAAALERLATDRPAAILLDLMMPVMDGFQFLTEYCQMAEWLSIPVVVITAKDPTPEELERLNGSVVRVLRKGQYSHEGLLREIHRRVDKHIQSDAPEAQEKPDVPDPGG